MNQWRVEYEDHNGAMVKLSFGSKQQAEKYAAKYFSNKVKEDPDANPPYVYESPPPSPSFKPLCPDTSRRTRLAQLIKEWNAVYNK